MRQFFFAENTCQSNCKYCFAKWEKFSSLVDTKTYKPSSNDEVVIYPCCDGEVFMQSDAFSMIRMYSKIVRKLYISISTKHAISDEYLEFLANFNDELEHNNKGFVKLSISVSNKSMIDLIEPGTLEYFERLELADRINKTNLRSSLILKPVLPFITVEEYFSIIDDFSKYINKLLIGGLYVDVDSSFFSKYKKYFSHIEKRAVSWLPSKPIWDYVVDEEQIIKIKKYASSNGIMVFDSDEDLVKSFI